MTVRPPAAAAGGGHGRRRAGRSSETFLTRVSIIEMATAPCRTRAVSFRPVPPPPIRSRPTSLTGRHRHGSPAAVGGPPAAHARTPEGRYRQGVADRAGEV